MTPLPDHAALQRLAEQAIVEGVMDFHEYVRLANPHVVLALLADVARLREALRAVEWAALAEDMARSCPCCWANRSIGVHEPDCQLAAAIGGEPR